MFTQADLGKAVKVRLLDSSIIRGTVVFVSAESNVVEIKTALAHSFPVKFSKISTVTWIGDHSS